MHSCKVIILAALLPILLPRQAPAFSLDDDAADVQAMILAATAPETSFSSRIPEPAFTHTHDIFNYGVSYVDEQLFAVAIEGFASPAPKTAGLAASGGFQ
jgi:hypothetical protein